MERNISIYLDIMFKYLDCSWELPGADQLWDPLHISNIREMVQQLRVQTVEDQSSVLSTDIRHQIIRPLDFIAI